MFPLHLQRTEKLFSKEVNTTKKLSGDAWSYFRDFEFTIDYISDNFNDDGNNIPHGFVASFSIPPSLGMFDRFIFSGLSFVELSCIPSNYETRMNDVGFDDETRVIEYKNIAFTWYPLLSNGWMGIHRMGGRHFATIFSCMPYSILDDFESNVNDIDIYRNLSVENRRRLLCILVSEVLDAEADMSTYVDIILDDITTQGRRSSQMNNKGIRLCPETGHIESTHTSDWVDSFKPDKTCSSWNIVHLAKSPSFITQSRICF